MAPRESRRGESSLGAASASEADGTMVRPYSSELDHLRGQSLKG
jgi:hypothetical protein